MAPTHNCVLPHAIKLPSTRKLVGKRVVLASSSPRRQEILRTIGFAPEVIPSKFAEDLPVQAFNDPHEYPVATSSQKAVEVYQQLVKKDPEDAPDLVIAADTVILTLPSGSGDESAATPMPVGWTPDVLEKPTSKEDQLRMLLDLNGQACEVVTGVTIVYPVLASPGYQIKCIDERTRVYFVDHAKSVLKAYVDSGEGIDRAGGFAIQGTGGLLIRKIDGDYQNVVGFPASSFMMLLESLIEEDEDFLSI